MIQLLSLAAWPVSATVYQPETTSAQSDADNAKYGGPFVILGRAVRNPEGEGYVDDTIFLRAVEVSATIRILQQIETKLYARD